MKRLNNPLGRGGPEMKRENCHSGFMTWGRRVLVALLVAALGGMAVTVAVNLVVYHFGNWPDQLGELFGFWGVLFGAFTAPFAFGMALALLRREIVPRRAARRRPIAWSLLLASVVGPPEPRIRETIGSQRTSGG